VHVVLRILSAGFLFGAVWGLTLGRVGSLVLILPAVAIIFLSGQPSQVMQPAIVVASRLFGQMVMGAVAVLPLNVVVVAVLVVLEPSVVPNTRTIILIALLTGSLPAILELGPLRRSRYAQVSFATGYIIGVLAIVALDVFGHRV
jgi:hypothetical protein